MRHLSCAETAKLVREALKVAFPSIKFSIRSKTYSGGASIRVEWNYGPTAKAVQAVAKKFEGADFDSQQDLKTYHESEVNGEKVHFGADFVFCERRYESYENERTILEKIGAAICAQYGVEYKSLNQRLENWNSPLQERAWEILAAATLGAGFSGTAVVDGKLVAC